jgi:nicotinamide riboside transporter PnuC
VNTVNLVWSIALSVVGITGIFIAGKKNMWGWFIGLSAQVLWIIFAIVTAQYGFILSAIAYGWVYGTNWLKWRKEHRKADENKALTLAN